MLLLLISTLLLAFVIYRTVGSLLKWRYMIEISRKLPSIAEPHWLWGHLNQFSDTHELRTKEKAMLKKNGAKMFITWLGPFTGFVGLSHPDTAKLLLKTSEPKPVFKPPDGYYFYRIWLGLGLLFSYGKKWERNRRLLTPAFHFDILLPYIRLFNVVADSFLENIKRHTDSGNIVEISDLVTLATMDSLLKCALSYESNVQTHSTHPYATAVKRLSFLITRRFHNPLVHSDWAFYLTPSGREVKKLTKYVHNFAEEIISARRKSLKEDPDQLNKRHLDFLDLLISAKDDDGTGLSDEEIREEVDTFLFAGHDTTASAISWATYYLGKYPEEQQKVYEEVRSLTNGDENFTWENINDCRYLALFLKEVMRLTPPVPIIIRYLTQPFVFEGVEIPAGESVGLIIVHINNHPNVWNDHEVFRPDRFLDDDTKFRDPYAYVPFSAGPRNCIGQRFAQDEMKVIIARLLLRYKISLVPGFEYIEDYDVVTKAMNGIKLHMEER